MNLETTAAVIGLLGSGGVIGIIYACIKGVTYVTHNVIRPVKMTVQQLEEVIKELRNWMDELRRESQEQDKRLTLVEEAIKLQERRLDTIEKRLNVRYSDHDRHDRHYGSVAVTRDRHRDGSSH